MVRGSTRPQSDCHFFWAMMLWDICYHILNVNNKNNKFSKYNPICAENVALNKTASMSSAYVDYRQTEQSGPACLAVNGNRSHTIYFIKSQPPSTVGINCIHTSEWSFNPWWSVDLGAKFTITYVTIYNRDSSMLTIASFILLLLEWLVLWWKNTCSIREFELNEIVQILYCFKTDTQITDSLGRRLTPSKCHTIGMVVWKCPLSQT